MSPDEFDARVRFVAELARRLHQYGTSAPRLERAIDGVSARLGLLPTSLSTPTSITLSFVDPDDGELALPRRTMVMRVNPGDVNLRRLCEVDAIAERVLAQQIGITEGLAELRALRTGLSVKGVGLQVLSFGIAGATVTLTGTDAASNAVSQTTISDLDGRWTFGDLIAGTWVVEVPRRKLEAAMSVAPAATTIPTATAPEAPSPPSAYRFGEAELAVYGEYELQTLERVLREDRAEAMVKVHEAICRKIGWEPGAGDERAFLEAYYTQLRARLESGMRMGKRKADKFAEGG